VGIDPDEHVHKPHSPPSLDYRDGAAGIATTSSADPARATPRHGGRRKRKTEVEPHRSAGGQPRGEHPAGRLDRVWPDTGPRGIA
jgi:hypothetical protein